MSEPPTDDQPPSGATGPPPRPLQFGLRTLLVVTAFVAALFSALGWLGVSPRARLVVLGVLGVSAAAAVGLLAALAGASRGDEDDDDRDS